MVFQSGVFCYIFPVITLTVSSDYEELVNSTGPGNKTSRRQCRCRCRPDSSASSSAPTSALDTDPITDPVLVPDWSSLCLATSPASSGPHTLILVPAMGSSSYASVDQVSPSVAKSEFTDAPVCVKAPCGPESPTPHADTFCGPEEAIHQRHASCSPDRATLTTVSTHHATQNQS